MAADSLFQTVPVKVQKKSGFDKSHMNLLTTKCGTLTPILVDEVIPNETVNLKVNLSASLPPLASETFMRVDLKAEAFFCPLRLLYGGFEKWFTRAKITNMTGSGMSESTACMPLIEVPGTKAKAGTLMDYLGLKVDSGFTQSTYISPLPMIAYHKIYDDWYRNSLVQQPVFRDFNVTNSNLTGPTQKQVGLLPYITFSEAQGRVGNNILSNTGSASTFADGVSIWDLRQRNFGHDYFTTATPQAQNGDAQSVGLVVPLEPGATSAGTSFTIGALRAANSIQQYLERLNLAGNRYVDQLRGVYNAHLSDGVAQRPILLGSASWNVYSKGIYQTANGGVSGGASGNNPMGNTVGAQYGNAYASGTDFIIKGFTANEPGYIFVIASLVPVVTYGSGTRRYLKHFLGDMGSAQPNGVNGQGDMANPMLQNVGPQPIYGWELGTNLGNVSIFGYQDRYAEYKSMNDELHGLLRDGQTLESFALQRTFGTGNTEISTSFLQIPTTYLDQVSAVEGDISKYGVWIDSYMDYKVSMPLSRYCIPTLQDPAYEHGDEITMRRGGTHL